MKKIQYYLLPKNYNAVFCIEDEVRIYKKGKLLFIFTHESQDNEKWVCFQNNWLFSMEDLNVLEDVRKNLNEGNIIIEHDTNAFKLLVKSKGFASKKIKELLSQLREEQHLPEEE